jgi:hypothetical protein
MTTDQICKTCRYFLDNSGRSGVQRGECRRRPDFVARQTSDWCGDGKWKEDGEWLSWCDIIDLEEAITRELNRKWRGQGEPIDE